jgi:UDP:flavonoid glycosyltransferase YjiC (YdhE family)
MRFLQQPIDTAQAAQWCDIAILNATHGMLVAMLLAGKPTLNVPIQMEQRLLSLKVVEMRAGVAASANEPHETIKALDYVIENRVRLAGKAGEFANRYRDFDANKQVRRLVERLHGML